MFNIINILYNNPKLQLLGNYCGIYYIWHMSSAAGAALCQIRRRFDANASSRTTRIGRIGADCRWLSAPNGWHFSIQKWLDFCHQTMGICWHQTLGIEDLKTLIDPSKLMTYAVCRMIFVHFGHFSMADQPFEEGMLRAWSPGIYAIDFRAEDVPFSQSH